MVRRWTAQRSRQLLPRLFALQHLIASLAITRDWPCGTFHVVSRLLAPHFFGSPVLPLAKKIAMTRRSPPTPAAGRRVWLLCLVVLALPGWAVVPPLRGGRFALLVSVAGNPGQPRLAGAQRDIDQARAVARAAGVPDGNMLALREREASGEGIRRALGELALRLAPADRVLIYFSGMGSRRADADRPGGCEEVFIAGDGEALGYGELATLVVPVAERAEKTAVFFDSCATPQRGNGGTGTRCVAAAPGGNCRIDANTRWRNFTSDIRKAAVPTSNIVSVHAGRPDKAALDEPPSAAISRCLLADAPDLDQSGALSLAELAGCVSQAAGAGSAPITHNGNSGFVPFMPKAAGQGPIARLFDDIAGGRDGRKMMVLETIRSPAGVDGPAVSLRASAVGYLYLIASDGDDAARLLYPSLADGSNRVAAGATVTFPRAAGVSPLAAGVSLLAILADNERDLALLPAPPGKSFATNSSARKALYDFANTSLRAAEAPCQASGQERNLSLWRACSDAYGAAVIVITPK